jgi:surface polysaccharide O-acyltransferase-like enzyme
MTTSSINKKTSVVNNADLRRDLFLTILAGQAFVAAPYVSQGWFLVVVTYVLLVTALFHCIKTHSEKPIANWVFWCVNLLGCSGLTAALLFSGRGVV